MKIIVNGRPRSENVTSKVLRDAAEFYIDLLMGEHAEAIENSTLTINSIKGLLRRHDSIGFCRWMDCPIRPQEFLIELDAELSYRQILISLAHECVHVMQMALGFRQESYDGVKQRWMGMLIDVEKYHYYDLPWEIDAHGREYGLYHRYRYGDGEDKPAVETAKRSPTLKSILSLA